MNKPNVLIVEDDVTLAKMLQEIIGIYDMSARVAGDGAQAMERLKDGSFDLIMLDMSLPRVSGQEVLDYVRSAPHLSGAKVAAMTGNKLLTPELDEVADYVFLKPYTLVAIENMLNEIGLT